MQGMATHMLPCKPYQVWLKSLASQVSQALTLAAATIPPTRPSCHVLNTFVALCDVLAEEQIPYGILVGYALQTGMQFDNHCFTDDTGRVIRYVMPKMKPGCMVREDQFVDIAKQGMELLQRGEKETSSPPNGEPFCSLFLRGSQLGAGLDGLVELCKELLVWRESEVRITKVRAATSLTKRERNLFVLQSCCSFDLVGFQSVRGATAFMHDSSIMDHLELKLMSELPRGDYVFFPFQPADGTLGS